MTALPAKTSISNTYPNPKNSVARAGFAQLWDAVNEAFEKPELDLASATTCDIGGQLSTKLRINGTTAITSFGTNFRGPILLRMAGALTITHNSTTLLCPGNANLITTYGDVLIAWPKSTTSGTTDGWQVVRLAYGSGIPVFSAFLSGSPQSLSPSTWTKVNLTVELFDIGSALSSGRFTATAPGYYLFSFVANLNSTSMTQAIIALYRNGAESVRGAEFSSGNAFTAFCATGASMVYLGIGDYVEVYAYVAGATPSISSGNFSGCLVRPL